MKTRLFVWILAGAGAIHGLTANENISHPTETEIITEGIRFCESTYPYKGGLLIGNFGTEQLNPLNKEKKGYILYYKDQQVTPFIPADGHLSAPKGMFEKEGYLYICDVNRLVVYNLQALDRSPQIVSFPSDDLFLNDLAASGNTLYISVTNSGRIYTLDISRPQEVEKTPVTKWLDIPGPNGILIDGDDMYIASYPADGNTTDKNVIYKVSGLKHPMVEKFFDVPGQYDGLVLSPDKKTLYISNWAPAEVSAIDMDNKKQTILPIKQGIVGPADMTWENEKLYIPDLPNSRVIIYSIR